LHNIVIRKLIIFIVERKKVKELEGKQEKFIASFIQWRRSMATSRRERDHTLSMLFDRTIKRPVVDVSNTRESRTKHY